MKEVIEYATINGVSEAERYFNINNQTIYNWLNEKDFIFKMSDERNKLEAIKKQKETERERERIRKLIYFQKTRPKRNPETKRKWYGENKEKIAFQEKTRLEKCIFKKRANVTNSMAKMKNIEGKITALDLWKIAKKQKLICPFCGLKLNASNMSVDHIIPTSQGGKNISSNVRLVHLWVNKMRLDYKDEDFIKMCRLIAAHVKD